MKLNNKGFAITSLLYGVLILFSFFVGSYLLALSSKNKIKNNIALSIEKEYLHSGYIGDIVVGGRLYDDPTFSNGFNSIKVYNNLENGNVLNNRISFKNPYGGENVLQIKTKGKADVGLGGFTFKTKTSPSLTLFSKICAKIPSDYDLKTVSNHQGSNAWHAQKKINLNSHKGTNNWKCYLTSETAYPKGSGGPYETSQYYYLKSIKNKNPLPNPKNPVIWYVGYATVYSSKASSFPKAIWVEFDSRVKYYGISNDENVKPNIWNEKDIEEKGTVFEDITTPGIYYIWVKDEDGFIDKKPVKVN